MQNCMKQDSLIVKNLSVALDKTPIVKGVSFSIRPGETHVIMGPNGSGKSTLLASLMGLPHVHITRGSIMLGATRLTKLLPEERACKRLFLGFQNPPGISGVALSTMLRHATKALDGESKKQESITAFAKRLKDATHQLDLEQNFITRSVNEGFSGGERKKSEILQLLMLEPRFAFLDEIDSGLDVDALRLCLRELQALQERIRSGFLYVTHNPRVLSLLKATKVHVMIGGRIVATGGVKLAKQIENKGYAGLAKN